MSAHIKSHISGKTLPHQLWGAAVIEHEDTFIIIGGEIRSGLHTNKTYKYVKDGGQWVEMPTTLSEGKALVTAVQVKSSFFKSCQRHD